HLRTISRGRIGPMGPLFRPRIRRKIQRFPCLEQPAPASPARPVAVAGVATRNPGLPDSPHDRFYKLLSPPEAVVSPDSGGDTRAGPVSFVSGNGPGHAPPASSLYDVTPCFDENYVKYSGSI